jgi:hypothetical protein
MAVMSHREPLLLVRKHMAINPLGSRQAMHCLDEMNPALAQRIQAMSGTEW